MNAIRGVISAICLSATVLLVPFSAVAMCSGWLGWGVVALAAAITALGLVFRMSRPPAGPKPDDDGLDVLLAPTVPLTLAGRPSTLKTYRPLRVLHAVPRITDGE